MCTIYTSYLHRAIREYFEIARIVDMNVAFAYNGHNIITNVAIR